MSVPSTTGSSGPTGAPDSNEALLAADRKLEDIIDFLPDATFVIDQDRKIAAWNLALEEMTGVPKNQMLGRGDRAYAIPFYGEDRPVLVDLLGDADPEGLAQYDCVRQQGNQLYAEAFLPKLFGGRGAHVWITASVLRDEQGRFLGAIESVRDVTDRKRVEIALRESEEQFRTVVTASKDGMITIDERGTIMIFNPAAEEIFGRSSQEMRDRPLENLIAEEAREQYWRYVRTHFQSPPGQRALASTIEVPALRASGKVFPLEVSLSAGDLAEKRFLLAVVRDISLHRRAEEEKAKLEAQLRQAQKLEAIGTLAGGIAHDFNNVLGAIIGYTELALEDVNQTQSETIHCLRAALQAAGRAKELIAQILAFSRQGEQEYRPIRLGPIFKEVAQLLRATIPTTIEIHTLVDTSSDMVLGDPTQMHQVMMNLCTNAAYSMRDSTGLLSLTLDNVELSEEETLTFAERTQAGHYVRMTIQDTGSGISAELLERIFDPFFTTKPKGEGTGMGLAVVHGIVANHEGAIRVHSQLQRGTTFEVFLPVLLRESDTGTQQDDRTMPRGNGERILLVDDEAPLVDVLCLRLRRLGYEVVGMVDSQQAWERLRAQPGAFDMVLTDQTMPRLTGLEMARMVSTEWPKIPIILCTGYSEQVSEEWAEACGIRAVCRKPVDMQALAGLIAKLISRS